MRLQKRETKIIKEVVKKYSAVRQKYIFLEAVLMMKKKAVILTCS